MVYSKYGIIFRKIREQKKMSLTNFPKIGISKAALSKFERGQAMMSFESVVCALQEMGVTLEEYESFLNAYSSCEEESLWEEIEKAAFRADKRRLQDLQDTAHNADLYFMGLACKACYTRLTPQEAEEITDYLYEIEIWSFGELRLLYFSMESLRTKDILHILDFFFPEGHELFNSKKHQKYFVQVCCRAVTYLTEKGYRKEGWSLLQQMDAHSLMATMSQRNLKNITEGYWIYRFEDPLKGKKKIMAGFDVLRTVHMTDELSYYQRRYSL